MNSGQAVGSVVKLVELVQENKLNLELFAMTCWTSWNCQNKVRLNELRLPLDRIVDHAFNILQVFQRAHPALPKPVRPTRPSWKPPDPHELKTNFDGAIFDDLSAAGMGW